MTSDPSGKAAASIHLDYGADSADFSFEDLFICSRGLRIKTRWSFAPGAELSVNFQLPAPASYEGWGAMVLRTHGVGGACAREGDGGYVATVLFLEVTDDILALVRDLSALEQEEEANNG